MIRYRAAQQLTFPDTTYAVDSGGDPMAIPSLSFDQFKAPLQPAAAATTTITTTTTTTTTTLLHHGLAAMRDSACQPN